MTDRELLELAAKAAGIELAFWNNGEEPYSSGVGFVLPNNAMWNPLTDDGAAFRLAVGLYMRIEDAVYDHLELNLCDYEDRCAATRRAIVCEAAKRGKEMA